MELETRWIPEAPGQTEDFQYYLTARKDPAGGKIIATFHGYSPGGEPGGLILQLTAHKAIAHSLRIPQLLESGFALRIGEESILSSLPAELNRPALKTFAWLDWWNHVDPAETEILIKASSRISLEKPREPNYENGVAQVLALKGLVSPEEVVKLHPEHPVRLAWEALQIKDQETSGLADFMSNAGMLLSFLHFDGDNFGPLYQEVLENYSGKTHHPEEIQRRQFLREVCKRISGQGIHPLPERMRESLRATYLKEVTPENNAGEGRPGFPTWFEHHGLVPDELTLYGWMKEDSELTCDKERQAVLEILSRQETPGKDSKINSQFFAGLTYWSVIPDHWLENDTWLNEMWQANSENAVTNIHNLAQCPRSRSILIDRDGNVAHLVRCQISGEV